MYYYEFVNLKNRGCFLRGKIRVFDEIGGYFRLGIPRIGGYFQNPRQSVYPLAQLSGGAGVSNSITEIYAIYCIQQLVVNWESVTNLTFIM